MTSGISWTENRPETDPRNGEPHPGNKPNPIRHVLSKAITAPPDTQRNYNGGGTDVLAEIIERASGVRFDQFAQE